MRSIKTRILAIIAMLALTMPLMANAQSYNFDTHGNIKTIHPGSTPGTFTLSTACITPITPLSCANTSFKIFPMSGYTDWSMQITSIASGSTVNWYSSNDGINFVPASANISGSTPGVLSLSQSASTLGKFNGIGGSSAYIAVVETAIGSTSTVITPFFGQNPSAVSVHSLPFININPSEAPIGVNIISGGGGGGGTVASGPTDSAGNPFVHPTGVPTVQPFPTDTLGRQIISPNTLPTPGVIPTPIPTPAGGIYQVAPSAFSTFNVNCVSGCSGGTGGGATSAPTLTPINGGNPVYITNATSAPTTQPVFITNATAAPTTQPVFITNATAAPTTVPVFLTNTPAPLPTGTNGFPNFNIVSGGSGGTAASPGPTDASGIPYTHPTGVPTVESLPTDTSGRQIISPTTLFTPRPYATTASSQLVVSQAVPFPTAPPLQAVNIPGVTATPFPLSGSCSTPTTPTLCAAGTYAIMGTTSASDYSYQINSINGGTVAFVSSDDGINFFSSNLTVAGGAPTALTFATSSSAAGKFNGTAGNSSFVAIVMTTAPTSTVTVIPYLSGHANSVSVHASVPLTIASLPPVVLAPGSTPLPVQTGTNGAQNFNLLNTPAPEPTGTNGAVNVNVVSGGGTGGSATAGPTDGAGIPYTHPTGVPTTQSFPTNGAGNLIVAQATAFPTPYAVATDASNRTVVALATDGTGSLNAPGTLGSAVRSIQGSGPTALPVAGTLKKTFTQLTTTPLAASATYTSAWFDTTLDNTTTIEVTVFPVGGSSATSGFSVQTTSDITQTTTYATLGNNNGSTGASISAGTLGIIRANVPGRYWRIVYVNGISAQTAFEVNTVVSSAPFVPVIDNGGNAKTSLWVNNSTTAIASLTGSADANSSSNTGLLNASYGLVYNGSSWDRLRLAGLGADTVFPTSPSTSGTSLGTPPVGTRGVEIDIPPGAAVSEYISTVVATSAANAALIAHTYTNPSSATTPLTIQFNLTNSQLMWITNVGTGTATTYISGLPTFRWI